MSDAPRDKAAAYAGRTKYDAPGRAARYARRSARRDAEERALLARVVPDATPGATALDAPCGVGRLAAFLLEKGYAVRGADLSPAMREGAEAALGPHPRWLGAEPLDLEEPPTPTAATYDLVLCFRVLHHLPDAAARARVLRSLAARARGPVVVSYHHPVSLHHVARALRRVLTGRRGDRHALTTSRLAREAAACGLVLERAVGLAPYRRDLWVAVLTPTAAAR
ncbi:MAG: methyltransferase domain-containing protein [Planctomycetota bacterium]